MRNVQHMITSLLYMHYRYNSCCQSDEVFNRISRLALNLGLHVFMSPVQFSWDLMDSIACNWNIYIKFSCILEQTCPLRVRCLLSWHSGMRTLSFHWFPCHGQICIPVENVQPTVVTEIHFSTYQKQLKVHIHTSYKRVIQSTIRIVSNRTS
jgi:hypothetical protein